uniref:G-protein coupled receptors family 1 profile domain-containing protein n=1 Tax=Periophthalmus magnuspinnatus TaxID=409849 RepID=A0A3B4ALC9_9GOBI
MSPKIKVFISVCICNWNLAFLGSSTQISVHVLGTAITPDRVSRGTKGAWRRRGDQSTLSTLNPDRFFTTPRTAHPPVNSSVRVALLPLSGGARWAYAVLLLALVMFSVGLVGNLALMCLVWHSVHLKSAWNCVLAGLALWDFLVLFFCLPVVLFHQLTGTRLMGALSCSLVPFLEVSASMGVATFSLCALSIDRFHSATSPTTLSMHVEPCTSILPKLSVEKHTHYSTQVDVCLAEPSSELPLSILSLVLTYQEARSWWVFGCYFCLPLLFTLSCDLVTRRVMSQREAQVIGRQEVSSRSSSLSVIKKERMEREAGLRSVVLALIGLYSACTLPEAVCTIAMSYLPLLPVGVSPALRLIGQFLLFVRCSATPLLTLTFNRALGGAFLHCCCCCCDECGAIPPPALDTPSPSLATPSTLLAMPLSAMGPPLRDTPTEQQRRVLGTPC